MRLVVFDRPDNGGQVTINTALVKEIQASILIAANATTRLIFDESDHFDVVGDLAMVAETIGLNAS